MTQILRFSSRAALLGLVLATSAAAQTKSGPQKFVTTKGADTVAVELFSREGNTLTSEIYQTNGPKTQYTIDLKPDGAMSHVEVTRVMRNNQSVGLSIFFLDTLVKAQISAGGENQQLEMPSRNAMPFLAPSFALCEQILKATHLAVGKSATLTAVRLGVIDTATMTVTRFHADSASFTMRDVDLKVALSSTGEVVGGRNVVQGWLIERKR